MVYLNINKTGREGAKDTSSTLTKQLNEVAVMADLNIRISIKNTKNYLSNLRYVDPEIWRDIQGYEGYYQVSNFGRVKSLDRIIERSDGIKVHYKGRILKPAKNKKGYNKVALTKNCEGTTFRVSRLVAIHFVENPENKSEVNHINGIKDDDWAGNLEWNTRSENMLHAVKSGLWNPKKGEDNGMAKLNKEDVIKIRELKKQGVLQYKIAEKFNVDKSLIGRIVNDEIWCHV